MEQEVWERWRAEVDKGQTPQRIDKYLAEHMTGTSRNRIQNAADAGNVWVNGKPVNSNYKVKPLDIIQVLLDHEPHDYTIHPEEIPINVVYEDEDIIVIDKPAGLLSIASDNEKVETAYRLVLDYLKNSNPKNRVYVTHRIDKETSGILMFTKNDKLREELQNSWNEIVTKRGYYALVEGKVEKNEDTIVNYLMETSTNVMYASNDKKHGKKAVTHYKVIKSSAKYSLLDVNIDSGRKNQIRVAMANIDHPIVGDDKYGNKNSAIKRLGLHAYELDINIKGKEFKFISKMPSVFNSVFAK